MATMIPPYADEGIRSSGERRVFERLDTDPATEDWTVIHSLGLANRPSGPFGEIDFVVIIPDEGIICLEVKGGRVACESGEWTTTDRSDRIWTLNKSPFMQARETMFALRESIRERFGSNAIEYRCPVGYGVVFPDVECPPVTPEFRRWEVIDRDDLRSPISRSIMSIARNRLREFQREPDGRIPTNAQIRSLINFLRPNFERVVTKGTTLERTESKLLSLTEEQYMRLDELRHNPRCLFEGAAGTGKTLLALEFARRADRAGNRVLFVCFNRLLGEWLEQMTVDSDIVAGTWHGVARRLIMSSSFADEFSNLEEQARQLDGAGELFTEHYPLYSQMAAEELERQFEVLVVDEAQDLSEPYHLDFFDASLYGGLAGGRWAIFGDFTRQALYNSSVDPLEALSNYCDERFTRATLTLNCRNTRRIAEETSNISGFRTPPFRLGQEDGPPVEHRYYRGQADMVSSLDDVVRRLIRGGVPTDGIVILSANRFENSGLAGVDALAGIGIVDFSNGMNINSAGLRFSTVHSFKGMESQVVFVVDIDDVDSEQAQALLYVGMSRARGMLILMIDQRARASMERRIREAIFQEMRR